MLLFIAKYPYTDSPSSMTFFAISGVGFEYGSDYTFHIVCIRPACLRPAYSLELLYLGIPEPLMLPEPVELLSAFPLT